MKELFEFKVPLSTITPLREVVEKSVGLDFMEDAEEILDNFSKIEAKGAFTVIYPSDFSLFHLSEKVENAFRQAQTIALFVATLGSSSKTLIDSYKADPLYYFMADFLASEFAEAMAGYMHEKIREYSENIGWHCSNRYSPGYCGWNVNEQGILFSFFPENTCGIRLTKSYIMNPLKSVSGAVAMGIDVRFGDYGCEYCSQTDCTNKSNL